MACVAGTARAQHCEVTPPGADWFYLGAPVVPFSRPAQVVLDVVTRGFDADLFSIQPRCLHITVLDKASLDARSRRLDPRERDSTGVVGFHHAKLGADTTVFVTPNPHIPLEVVMTHEVLHALSHRFTHEAQHRRLVNLVEGATDYITRELAVRIMSKRRDTLHSAYDGYVRFFQALMDKLGDEGPRLLADCYLRDGYDAFESAVDRKLGIAVGRAARALEHDDLGAALTEIGAR